MAKMATATAYTVKSTVAMAVVLAMSSVSTLTRHSIKLARPAFLVCQSPIWKTVVLS